MNKALLFQRVNYISKRDAVEAVQEFQSEFNWRLDGTDSVMDAGCGTGNIAHDVILPIMPPNFKRVVGIDVSNDMLEFARKTAVHPKLSFAEFNLDVDLENQSLNGIEPFDHITSFYCMMWVRNEKTCLQNFYKLLKPGGGMLLVFLSYHPIYDVYEEQCQDNRWARYLTGVNSSVSKYQHSKHAAEEFREQLLDSGFTKCNVSEQEKYYMYNDIEKLRGK